MWLPPLPPFVNVDSMQIIKTSASQQKTEQTRQQQVNHQHIPIKACQKYSSHGPGINIDKGGGEGGGKPRGSHHSVETKESVPIIMKMVV